MNQDFSKGAVWRNIVSQAVPLTLAQLVQLLYNVVDRIYLGHLPGTNNLALTGVGLTFPIVALVAAFSCLFGMGGAPLFAIARGAKKEKEADKILGSVFTLLVTTSIVLIIFCYCFRKPILYLFGASDASYVYADEYLKVYILGTTASMVTMGMNGFINGQGYPRIGMLTTVIGAVLNLILDPVFIFMMGMGVKGAALATIISQFVSALWILRFLTSKKAVHKLWVKNMKPEWKRTKEILFLGMAGFIMQATNCVVQITCNATLQIYGGDLYIGVMTVLNSVREVLMLPVLGISNGAQPVLGYNYGAKEYGRVKTGIRFTSLIGTGYTLLIWGVIMLIPHFFFRIFTSDSAIIEAGPQALHIYFFGFFFMAFQFAGQSVFQGLGKAKFAITFSLLRKVVIVVPLTLILPKMGLGVNGVFMAEPISNAIGGLACFITMWMTVYKKLED